MQLREISANVYAAQVLPLTAPLWAGSRTLQEYATQTLEFARSAYGRRHYQTVGLYDGGVLVSSFKRYERTLHFENRTIRGIGFGAVFTPERYRCRGYASVMLGAALDRARSDGYDLAFLFSDIRPQFYAALGFCALASRRFSVRADTLPSMRLDFAHFAGRAWSAVRRIFDRCESRRHMGFMRNDAAWDWIKMRLARGSQHPGVHETNLILRRRGRIVAYVFGARSPEMDAYVVEEFGVADDAAAALLPAFLRGAAGDLRRLYGWLPPNHARELLPKPSVRRRTKAILMMAPLRSEGAALIQAASNARDDFCWATDHV